MAIASKAVAHGHSGADSEGSLLTYDVLGLDDIHLGYPGHFTGEHPIHSALAKLKPGDALKLRAHEDEASFALFDAQEICVARLSRKAAAFWQPRLAGVREVRVLAIVHRSAEQQADPARRSQYKVPEWEVPVAEVLSQIADNALV